MWYFAYGSNLNSKAVVEWSRHFGHKPPPMKPGRPAVLDNYRLSFPIFSEYWGGGIGDIVYDPGKYVMGAVFDLSDTDLAILDLKVQRKLDTGGKEIGVYRRIEVDVAPSAKVSRSRQLPIKASAWSGITSRPHSTTWTW